MNVSFSLNSENLKKATPFLMGAIVVIAAFSYFTSNSVVSVVSLLDQGFRTSLKNGISKKTLNLEVADLGALNTAAVQASVETLKSVLLFLSVASICLCCFTQGIVSRTMLLVFGVVNCIALYLSISVSISTADWCSLLIKTYNELIENVEKESNHKLSDEEKKITDLSVLQFKHYVTNVSWFQTAMTLIAVMSAIEMVLTLGLFFINRTKKTVESKI